MKLFIALLILLSAGCMKTEDVKEKKCPQGMKLFKDRFFREFCAAEPE